MPRTSGMTPPSTSRSHDRVEAGGQVSGRSNVGDAIQAGKPDETSAKEQSAALDALQLAEDRMTRVLHCAQDGFPAPPNTTDIKKALEEFHMAQDGLSRAHSYAGVVADEPRLLSAPSGAGVKRSSNTVARRVTGEGNRPPPVERARDVDATTMHVVADEAFAIGTLTL